MTTGTSSGHTYEYVIRRKLIYKLDEFDENMRGVVATSFANGNSKSKSTLIQSKKAETKIKTRGP